MNQLSEQLRGRAQAKQSPAGGGSLGAASGHSSPSRA